MNGIFTASANPIAFGGAQHLAKYLSSSSSLKKLVLKGNINFVEKSGIDSIAASLEKNTSLQSLDLSGK